MRLAQLGVVAGGAALVLGQRIQRLDHRLPRALDFVNPYQVPVVLFQGRVQLQGLFGNLDGFVVLAVVGIDLAQITEGADVLGIQPHRLFEELLRFFVISHLGLLDALAVNTGGILRVQTGHRINI